MASLEFLAVILTGLGLTASIVYYASILNNTSKARRARAELKPKLAVFNHVALFRGVSDEEVMKRTRVVYDGPLVMGEDLMTFEIGDQVQVINR